MPDYNYFAPWYSQREKINKVVIENGVTNIGANAFYQCNNLNSITIPNSVTSIGDCAFLECLGLTSVTIPNSVTSIGGGAFYGCSGLTSVTIPNSVTSIGGGSFSGCSGLTSVHITDLVSWCKINFMDYDSDCSSNPLYYAKHLYISGKEIENLVIPNGITKIENYAFYNCKSFKSITIPNSVTSIGNSAFYGCSEPTSITVDEGNKYYDSRNNCNAIIETKSNTLISGCKNTIIPNSVTSIGGGAFYGCSGLTSITIPNSVTSIGYSAFEGCSGLTSITIPESVTSIGNSAFEGCSGLTSITIPESVTSIGNSAFRACSGLTSITIPESVTSIGYYAFYGAKLRNIVIKAKTPPSGGTDGTFSYQSYNHTTLMIPEGSWDAYAYDDDNWYRFINIREVAYNTVNLTNSKAYMLKSSNEGSYLFYDSVNDCVATLNETALDDTEENVTWMTTEVDGKHYVYNLGARKFLVADKTNAKTGYRLSDVPASIDIEDGKDAIVFGKSKEFYMVINDKLNVDENLESQIMTSTGINEIDVESNLPIVTYNLNGQRINNSNAQKGVFIKKGKKYTK